MAAPMAWHVVSRADRKRSANMDYTCITHISSVEKEPTQPLTVVRWRKLVTCAQKWIEIDGIDRALAAAVCVHDDDFAKQNYPTSSVASSDENLAHLLESNELGFHPTCYRRFIDKKRITSAEKLAAKQSVCGQQGEAEDDSESTTSTLPPSPKRLSSTTDVKTKSSKKSSNVLPGVCIICKKVDRYIKEAHKTKKDKLVQAKTLTAGSLVKAAESRADESILMCTRGKDCVANEVRYHKRCYKEYTSFLTKKTSDERLPKVWEYGDAYKAFCDTVIRARLIENQEILRMKKLSSLFQKFIKKHPGHGSYRTDLLKKRLQRDFPQLNFHKPPRRNLSEMVSTGTTGLLHQDFSTETHMSVSGETSSSDGEMVPESGKDAALRELSRTIYSAGILLKQVVKSAPSMDPTSEDLNVSSARKIVPV